MKAAAAGYAQLVRVLLGRSANPLLRDAQQRVRCGLVTSLPLPRAYTHRAQTAAQLAATDEVKRLIQRAPGGAPRSRARRAAAPGAGAVSLGKRQTCKVFLLGDSWHGKSSTFKARARAAAAVPRPARSTAAARRC